ncbi:MAG: glutamate--cysteine ligase [Candidatus Malihini olakiniferum]
MIPDISQALSWLENHHQAVKGIQRGIERETLRAQPNGHFAQTRHPENLGAALTHPWITTDFSEALLEFITPVDQDVDHLLAFLRDIHRYVVRNIGSERLWPFSMPCFIPDETNIELAQYGTSNIGRFKTLYREGLKNRYGALMQTISGVHYNFSLPLAFWQARIGVTDAESGKQEISAGYFRLIRNYYRFGWVIPYLFGASPAICSSFLQGCETTLPFERGENGFYYLPYATSLRLSNWGYNNKSQSNLDITFNTLDEYVTALKRAIKTPSTEYAALGVKQGEHYLQLNTNMLQIEDEFYAPIRPKRVTRNGETPSDAIMRGGIEYIEVRSLDINPFTPSGVSAEQVRFLDLFLIWCVLADAPEMDSAELKCTRKNWNRIILEGRKPGLTVGIGCETQQQPLAKVGQALFRDLQCVAEMLDREHEKPYYQQVCNKMSIRLEKPENTFSGSLLPLLKAQGCGNLGLTLADRYREQLSKEPLAVLTEAQFVAESERAWQKQHMLEAQDTLSFEAYLAATQLESMLR